MGALQRVLCIAACALCAAASARAAAPMRIVSLSGSLTEVVARLGFADRLVGVDRSSLRPHEVVARLPRVGTPRAVSIESVLAVSPTLVIAYDDLEPRETLERLRALSIAVVEVPRRRTVDAVRDKVTRIAAGLGVPEKGAALWAEISRDLAWPVGKARPSPRLRALFIQTMGSGPLMVAGEETAAAALLEAAEVENAVSGFTAYRPLNPEAAAAANPDAVIILRRAYDRIGGLAGLAALPGMGETAAVRHRRIVVADDSAYLGLGPGAGEAVRQLREALYGP
ncbi:MAG: hemin ABC transporter substrate-binding protein [Rhodospirillaceae bacterium]